MIWISRRDSRRLSASSASSDNEVTTEPTIEGIFLRPALGVNICEKRERLSKRKQTVRKLGLSGFLNRGAVLLSEFEF